MKKSNLQILYFSMHAYTTTKNMKQRFFFINHQSIHGKLFSKFERALRNVSVLVAYLKLSCFGTIIRLI